MSAWNEGKKDYLGNDVFGIFRRLQFELGCDFGQRNPGVGQRNPTNSRLDDIVMKSHNQGKSTIAFELIHIFTSHNFKLANFARTNSCKAKIENLDLLQKRISWSIKRGKKGDFNEQRGLALHHSIAAATEMH